MPVSHSSSLPPSVSPSSVSPPVFTFRSYQREDLARSAIHDGAIIAWDPGLGKTLAIFAWPYLKHSRCTLIVAPASLHDQIESSGGSYIAGGVLGMRPKYRLALTGTPIKNRLPDVFHLAGWVCGHSPEPTARWPYGNSAAHKSSFANNHLVMEENLTKQAAARKRGQFQSYRKQTNKVTNIHHLWKLLGPVIARRRKDQIGNDIVNKLIHPIRVLPGTQQQEVYRWHLAHPPECKTPLASLGAQLQALRQAALCPWSSGLSRHNSSIRWSPKMLAILHLAADLMEKGEQIIIYSPFQEFSTALKAALQDAAVSSLLLDGRAKNTLRGPLAADFKTGKYPVLIAGIESMGEGHSFECASHLVIPSLRKDEFPSFLP